MSDVSEALKNLKSGSNKEDSTPAPATQVEELYQQYTCSRVSTCLITPTGKRVNFTNYEYYTKDPDIIEYLNAEIQNGIRGIKSGQQVKAADINPMAALKRKHIEEFLASQDGRDYSSGTLSPEKLAAKSAMLSTAGVTNNA
jgi:hypothetical protein